MTWLQAVVAIVLVVTPPQAARAEMQRILPVDVKDDPFAPLPLDSSGQPRAGTGLCGGYRRTTDPSFLPVRDPDFPNGDAAARYSQGVNDFMDGKISRTGEVAAKYQTLQKRFDLAAQRLNLDASSSGDFLGTSECGPAGNPGCPFPASPDATGNPMIMDPFLSRFRGFFVVTDDLVGQYIHFGFTVDSAVSMRFYAKPAMPMAGTTQVRYELISRQFTGGVSNFRVTNSIRFAKAGLYAVEILHASVKSSARLELALMTSPFTDFDERADDMSAKPLQSRDAAFQLAAPAQFFLRLDGAPSFPKDETQCQECPREFAGAARQGDPGTNGCPACMACNEAATCQICNTQDHCGCKCDPCEPNAPYCAGDPKDQTTLHCVQCVIDANCPNGQNCVNNTCVGFCPCCDSPLKCTNVYGNDDKKGAALNCSECATAGDCPDNGYCDRKNGRCLPKAPEHNEDTDCGLNAVNCKESTKTEGSPRPYCLNGEVCVQCRWDVDCGRGSYCRSGDCIPCTDDRHCGPSCSSCGVQFAFDADGKMTGSTTTNTPVCYAPPAASDRVPAPAPTCVECITDLQCGPGGECDRTTHTCSKKQTCDPACAPGLVCSGGGCVECINSSQCKCGQCTAGLCTKSCGDSSDCNGTQCCAQETQTCTSGRCKPGLTAHGGALCCDTTAGGVGATEDPWSPVRSRAPLWTLLATLAMFAALRLRPLRPGRRGVRSGE